MTKKFKSGTYLYDDKVIGFVENFNAKKWFAKVTLYGMEDFAEYGTLDPQATVIIDGEKYTNPLKTFY